MGDNLPYNFDPNTGRFSGFRQNGPQNQSSRPVQANALPPGSSLLNNPTGASSTAGRTRFSSDIVAEDPNEITEEDVIHIMMGDLQRIKLYPAKGFQIYQEIFLLSFWKN